MAKPKIVLVFDKAINSLCPYAAPKAEVAPYYQFVGPYLEKLFELRDNRLEVRRTISHIKEKSLHDKLVKANSAAFTDYADEIIATMKRDELMLKDVQITFDMETYQQPRIRIELESEAAYTMFMLKYAS